MAFKTRGRAQLIAHSAAAPHALKDDGCYCSMNATGSAVLGQNALRFEGDNKGKPFRPGSDAAKVLQHVLLTAFTCLSQGCYAPPKKHSELQVMLTSHNYPLVSTSLISCEVMLTA